MPNVFSKALAVEHGYYYISKLLFCVRINMKTIYLDNGATTKICPAAEAAIKEANEKFFANPASIHHAGIEASKRLERARKTIANTLGASPEEIIFTSGGTESNNLAIKGLSFQNPSKKHIIASKIEHDCVLNSCKWLEERGYEITFLDVDKEGFVNLQQLQNAIRPDTLLVSIIHGNNEIGTLQNLQKIYEICKKKKAIFHTDACQSFTKAPLSAKMADMITINAHKMHGPKGIGALYIRKGIQLTPLAHGGGHQQGIRSGTQNVAAAAGFEAAIKEAQKQKKQIKNMQNLRDYFIKSALKIPNSTLNGAEGNSRLANNINISFAGVEGESVAALLDMEGICCSTGSACASKSLDPSHVIMAISNNSHERAHGSIRFTLSASNTKKEIDFTLRALAQAVKKLRKISPLKR